MAEKKPIESFRTALNGYRKSDVNEYIEKIQSTLNEGRNPHA